MQRRTLAINRCDAWKPEAMPLSASFDKPDFDFGAGNDRLFGVLARVLLARDSLYF